MATFSRDRAYNFEALRAAGGAPYSGGDVGEVVATMRTVRR